MSDDWNEEPAPEKKGIPKWVWIGCGGGCLVALILAIIAGVVFVGFVKDFADPDVAWEELAEVLPYDERPESWGARGKSVPFLGQGQYYLTPDSAPAMMIVFRFDRQAEVERLFDPESTENKGVFGVGAIQEPEAGVVEVQGRETRCLRFKAWVPDSDDEPNTAGMSIRVDLTGEGEKGVMVQIVRTDGRPDPVPDDMVTQLLEPFDVWRGK